MDEMYIRRNWNPPRRNPLAVLLAVVLVGGVVASTVLLSVRHPWWKKAAPAEAAPAEPPPALPAAAPAPASPQPVARAAPAPAPVPPPKTAAPGHVLASVDADPALPLLSDARQLREQGQLTSAREKCFAALNLAATPALRKALQSALGEINSMLLFSPAPMPEKIDYTIQKGDSLGSLARRNGTTVELLQKSNGLRTGTIRPGDRLRILSGTFAVVVDKSDFELSLFLNKRFFKRYSAGLGKYEKTPVGTFKITERIAQPPWWRDDGKAIPYGDPANVLGTHWLSLDIKGYGIHGTWQPETVGKPESAGCVRLTNEDIEELFTLLPVGTEVVIQD
jgi:LysM repeat protein